MYKTLINGGYFSDQKQEAEDLAFESTNPDDLREMFYMTNEENGMFKNIRIQLIVACNGNTPQDILQAMAEKYVLSADMSDFDDRAITCSFKQALSSHPSTPLSALEAMNAKY